MADMIIMSVIGIAAFLVIRGRLRGGGRGGCSGGCAGCHGCAGLPKEGARKRSGVIDK